MLNRKPPNKVSLLFYFGRIEQNLRDSVFLGEKRHIVTKLTSFPDMER